jgi:hypothetical protein
MEGESCGREGVMWVESCGDAKECGKEDVDVGKIGFRATICLWSK